MGFWLYWAFILMAVLAGAGALAFLDKLCRLATGRPPSEDVPSRPHAGGDRPAPGTTPGPGAGRHASVSRDDPGDRPAPALGGNAGAGRPALPSSRDQLDAMVDAYMAQLTAAVTSPHGPTEEAPALNAVYGAGSNPAGETETRPVPVIDPDMDLAAVPGPPWCGRGWHDGDCCPGSRTQWDGTGGPRPYLGTS